MAAVKAEFKKGLGKESSVNQQIRTMVKFCFEIVLMLRVIDDYSECAARKI